MTTLLNTRNNISQEGVFIESEYLIGELLASTEFFMLIMVASVWIFLRLYWWGICLISYFTDGQSIG